MMRSLSVVAFVAICSVALLADNLARCESGQGTFEKKVDGWKVSLGPDAAQPGSCQLVVRSRKKEGVFKVTAQSIRIDAVERDMNGDGIPDMAFQAGPAAKDVCCATYYAFSFGEHPRLLRKINGGASFSLEAYDSKRVPEIWAEDLEVFREFDGVRPAEVNAIPMTFLRLEGEKLVDASAEWQPDSDWLISQLRKRLSAERTQEFLATDGKLPPEAVATHPRLLETKALVLGVVWDYLYSGREQEAWKALEELWPASDRERIRALILQRRSEGILAQVDATAPPPAVYCRLSAATSEGRYRVGGGVSAPGVVSQTDPRYTRAARSARYQGTVVLYTVVAPDGCAHDIRVQRSLGLGLDESAIEALRQWKFKPATKNGVPVTVQVNIEFNFRLY